MIRDGITTHTIGGIGAFTEVEMTNMAEMIRVHPGWEVYIKWTRAWCDDVRERLETDMDIDVSDTVAKLRGLRAISDDMAGLLVHLDDKLKEIESERKK